MISNDTTTLRAGGGAPKPRITVTITINITDIYRAPLRRSVLIGSTHGNEDAVLISSFGVQSLLSIWHARNFAPDLDIVHLDIAGVEQDTARRYRDALADAYNFVPIILKVEREEDKDAVLEAVAQWRCEGFYSRYSIGPNSGAP